MSRATDTDMERVAAGRLVKAQAGGRRPGAGSASGQNRDAHLRTSNATGRRTSDDDTNTDTKMPLAQTSP